MQTMTRGLSPLDHNFWVVEQVYTVDPSAVLKYDCVKSIYSPLLSNVLFIGIQCHIAIILLHLCVFDFMSTVLCASIVYSN